ncbi:hypothetical protein [Paeniglutamicibacter cryotolerans]|uniref:Putative lipoprotein with Yx(FWY)xxD motif n=2 Tax=Paeniglutamicibacter cryotolerans TaxID=670079 RepID=A0A839QJ59_9MICC|nr:putative lipoprotein with Yx(FWY)xxD motif [Paeniglutamicibacter cryotolerans]
MAAVGLAAAALLTGCSSNGTTTPTTSAPVTTVPGDSGGYGATPGATAPSTAAVDLKTATSSLGPIVVDGNGMSLYFYTKDPKGTATSACTGGCLEIWPVALASGSTPKVDGVTGTVSTIKTPDGKEQLTLNGMPLYSYAQDAKPGDILGQGVGGVWYLASPDGAMIK